MFGLFGKKVRVSFTDHDTGEYLGDAKIAEKYLPESFGAMTTISFKGGEWQIMAADPPSSILFSESGQLSLRVRKIEPIDFDSIRYSLPTVCNETPATDDVAPQKKLVLEMDEDAWRQIEFLPVSFLRVVQQEMAEVKEILLDEKNKNAKTFDNIHVRTNVGYEHLDIDFENFCLDIGCIEIGDIRLQVDGENLVVKNGFVARSSSNTYYGTLQDKKIKELGLSYFESMDDELRHIIQKYQLLLVNWCGGSITTM